MSQQWLKMPPKKRQRFGKSSKAKKNQETRKNLSPDSKEKLCQATKESVQKHRANLDEEKLEDIRLQDLGQHQKRR